MATVKALAPDVVVLSDLEGWLSVSQTSHRIARGVTWVRQLVETGQIRGVLTSLGWLIDPASVDEWTRGR